MAVYTASYYRNVEEAFETHHVEQAPRAQWVSVDSNLTMNGIPEDKISIHYL